MDYAVRVSHYLDPVTFELSRDVILLLSQGHVAEVIVGGEVSGGLSGLAAQTLDLGDAVCLPGFVNAHAHLDLSHLHRQVPRGLAFTDWARAIIAGRQVPAPIIDAGIDDACRMAAATGTTAIIDISVGGLSAEAIARHGLRGVVALEVLQWDAAQAEAQMRAADEVVRRKFRLETDRLGADAGGATAPAALAGVDFGYSPHAPYTTGRELYQLAYGRAYGEGRVMTTHVSETPAELDFVRTATGPIADLMRQFGAWPGFAGHGTTPIELLLGDWLAPWLGESGPRLVLVHCNYPAGNDLDLVAAIKPTICWCPRSHAYFGHEPWPLHEYFETGANLVLGTDSLASNDGLDMWGEMQAAVQAQPDAPRTELLRMATINGRAIFDAADNVADLAIWELPADTGLEQMLNLWLGKPPRLLASFSQGQLVARAI
ncbi:MAG: amidohydrolase family protein [Planctomycetes bacterium]|nr:amidohydrolase family protein [Planctomycetota bacterium]MCW8134371.1 amidohydrolase family protein [Planctomycetota bacterium]